MEFVVEPIEGRANVFDFALAVVVLAFAESGAAEVEAQYRPAEAVQRFRGMEDDFVVQRTAEERVGVADDCGMRGVAAYVEQGFEASGGAFEGQGSNLRFVILQFGVLQFGSAHACQLLTNPRACAILEAMPLRNEDVFALTREMVDIESVTGNEGPVGDFLARELGRLGYQAQRTVAEGTRANIFATLPEAPHPAVVFSTHMDTVPPFIPSSEDSERIHGRGSCDAKGIIAAQIAAAEKLRAEGIYAGLLFVVGEERDSLGAKVANKRAHGSRFLINGEPTENHIATASKGALRVEVIAEGKMAHSAYPELGDSAIDKLLVALTRLRAMELPVNPEIGPSTLNIGVIEGGRAPNVIPDAARAQLLYRLVGPAEELRQRITEAVDGVARVEFILEIPYQKFRTVDGLPSMVAAFTTDIPQLGNWGEPLLIGPGSIHVAHTPREFIEKKQLIEAVDLYAAIARKLLAA